MSTTILRRVSLAVVLVAGVLAAPVTTAVAAPPSATVTFVAPTPAEGGTLTIDATSIAFTWDKKTNQTRSVSCALTGPTPSSSACSQPVSAPGGSASSGVSYSGLDNGSYTFTANVTVNGGQTTTAVRHFTVAVPRTIIGLRADYWENSSGRYLGVQAYSTAQVVNGNVVTGPAVSAQATYPDGTTTTLTNMSRFVDSGVYVRHRERLRLGAAGNVPMPVSIRFTSADGSTDTIPVRRWLPATSTPYPAGYVKDFVTSYLDPYQVRARLDGLETQFPGLITSQNLPETTSGYQRKAQTIVGIASPYAGSTAALGSADQARAVVITSRDQGHLGGNDLTVHLVDPAANNQPLTVSVTGNAITATLATDSTGVVTTTAAQLVAALNASPSVFPLVVASTYRGDLGAGVVVPQANPSQLSDFLNGPASATRGPFQQRVYRIGTDRSGAKLGVLLYCQESGREWVTPLVCDETVHRLVHNYATDPATKALLDNLEIFVLPSVNPDGATYSMYDSSGQAKTMADGCAATGESDPIARHTWGTAIGRNFSIGSIFDGYAGASTACMSEQFAGPSELSELESRNLFWVESTFPNIRFAANVSTGGTITWSPSSYVANGRLVLPMVSYGSQGYFRQVAQAVAGGVNAYRGTTIGADRVDPGVDQQGSEAGNSTDDAYYSRGIFAFDLGTGVPRNTGTTSDASIPTGVQPCFGGVGTGGGQGSCTAALVNEGHDQVMEFADGAMAVFAAALAYSDDTTAPAVALTGPSSGAGSVRVTFDADDATDVYYTTDGSTPTLASTAWAPLAVGGPRAPLKLTQTTTVRWIAIDVKGNVSSVQSRTITVT